MYPLDHTSFYSGVSCLDAKNEGPLTCFVNFSRRKIDLTAVIIRAGVCCVYCGCLFKALHRDK